MTQFVCNYINRISLLITSFFCLLVSIGDSPVTLAQQPNTRVQWNQATRIPSPQETSSWFPDLAVDSQGRVHVVWNETDHAEVIQRFDSKGARLGESVYYAVWDGKQWSSFNDIVPPQVDIIRQAMTIDGYDTLHLVFGWYDMYYQQAHADKAMSASAWTSPRQVNTRGMTYMKDIAVFANTVHIVYDDIGAEGGACSLCTDIYYRHSLDRGVTWSAPLDLLQTDLGASHAQIKVDKAGTVYVTWDEGWERLRGTDTKYVNKPKYSIYRYSTDGGNTWSSPTTISYPDSPNQLTVGANGQGGVMLVWETNSPHYRGIYYTWSQDHGESWSPPHMLPHISSRGWTAFDRYDMATDSAGHIHLLVVGYGQDEKSLKLYHFEWDGKNWSAPTPVYAGNWFPEYPHLVIHGGNQLHATWFTRQDMFNPVIPHQVWYAHGQSSAPAETPAPLPTLTPTPSPPISTPTVTATSSSILEPNLTHISVSGEAITSADTNTDDLMLLIESLLPVALLMVVIVIGVRLWRR